MNETDGMVVDVDGDHVWVRPRGEASACGACVQQAGCGMKPAGNTGQSLLRFPNTINARAGDAVVIRAAEGMVLRAVWVAYGVPLLFALLGAIGVLRITGSEGGSMVGMLSGLAGGFFLIRLQRNGWAGEHPALSIGFKSLSRFE